MYSTIVFMYRKYSENYHDVLKHCIYVQEVQHLLSRCTQTFYLCTESTVQTITMYLNIGFMYMRCYSATITLHSTIVLCTESTAQTITMYWNIGFYVYEVLQRKLSPCTQPFYLFTGGLAQIFTTYSNCIYLKEVQRKLSPCTQPLYLCTEGATARTIEMYSTMYLCTGGATAQTIAMF